MEKNTVLAIVLSIIVIIGFTFVQNYFFKPPETAPATAAQTTSKTVAPPTATTTNGGGSGGSSGTALPLTEEAAPVAENEKAAEQTVTVKTKLLTVTLSSKGGDVTSFLLNQHKDKDSYVNMVLAGTEQPHAFTLAFGGRDGKPITDNFEVNRVSDTVVEFYRDYTMQPVNGVGGGIFRLTKRYTFTPNEYMFRLDVSLKGGAGVQGYSFDGAAYTLNFGPQIGPRFEKLDNRNEYRYYYAFINGKQKTEKTGQPFADRITWASIAGKYFTFIAVPDQYPYTYEFSTKAEPGIPSASRFSMTRPAVTTGSTSDTFYFYLGPKTQSSLEIYNSGINNYHLTDMDMTKVANTSGILTPLEFAVRWLLNLFHKGVPNYGICVILLTLLIQLILFPFTSKSSEATLKMQVLQPRVQEMQEKYKDNPQQLQVKMAEFYKEEGYNPLSGCLPLLIQLPILFAVYNVFYNYFDMRGAMFIPGWIPDLSAPDSIYHLSFSIPILGWTDIRLLPILYAGSQILSTKLTQPPGQGAGSNQKMMKFMMWGMPIIFFFILYDMPSGLNVYWICRNLMTLVQQLIINQMMRKKKEELKAVMDAKEARKKLVLPPKAKKKK
jgi:YidC/Oxa1 family membrane protein insertase